LKFFVKIFGSTQKVANPHVEQKRLANNLFLTTEDTEKRFFEFFEQTEYTKLEYYCYVF
jgi:hypothetical protein